MLHNADSYAQQLRDQGAVIASFAERRADIVQQLKQAADQVGGGVAAIEDEALLDEVTALVERPNVLVCQFEEEFLAVPQECLILTMKANQKYFPLLDAQGKLTHQFLIVSNIAPHDASAVIQGNERVVRPRLADAKFFFDQDRKKTLASRVPQLAKVVYHNQLGTQGERVERVRAIAKAIAVQLFDNLGAQHASLNSHEGEVAQDWLLDLRGQRRLAGQDRPGHRHGGRIPRAARHHGRVLRPERWPARHRGPRHRRPLQTPLCRRPAAARQRGPGRGAGRQAGNPGWHVRHWQPAHRRPRPVCAAPPCAGRDPHAGRKSPAAGAGPAHRPRRTGVWRENPRPGSRLAGLFYDRLAVSLREQGYSAQEVDAVLALRPQRLSDVAQRLAAVRAFAALPEAPALAAANKRVGNILKKAETAVQPQVNAALLQEAAEKDLYAALQTIAAQAQQHWQAGDTTAHLQTLAALRAPVDAFFEHVMVNADDVALKNNRLGLLASLHQKHEPGRRPGAAGG